MSPGFTEINLNRSNLVVGGCSFTYTYDHERQGAWPYYLRDLGGFSNVYDSSCPGAGNNHIHRAVITQIELNDIDPKDSLVVVMWSGYDRDDLIVDPRVLKLNYPDRYQYTENTAVAMTGGQLGESNIVVRLDNVKKIKNPASRALENYIAIRSLYSYLTQRGFDFVFLEFSDAGTLKDANFDPVPHLPPILAKNFTDMVRTLTPTLGTWALPTIDGDGYHPNAVHHQTWTRQILLPHLQHKLVDGNHVALP